MSTTDTDHGEEHVYDDIVEQDNKLPNWWLYTLYGAIVFGLGYWIYYSGYGGGQNTIEAYQAERRAEHKAELQKVLAAGELTPESLVAMSKNPTVMAEGKGIFEGTCASCHRKDGGGLVGPNLTDSAWIHGGQPLEVARSIRDGWPVNGMRAWGGELGEIKVRAVAAYVLTLRDTNVAEGKAPQGVPMVKTP